MGQQPKARELHRAEHAHLLSVLKCLPTDFEPWGQREREGSDCSCGCAYFVLLEGALGADWGVCVNPNSPRVGLLTFEHQGCPQFTYNPVFENDDALDEKFPLARFLTTAQQQEG